MERQPTALVRTRKVGVGSAAKEGGTLTTYCTQKGGMPEWGRRGNGAEVPTTAGRGVEAERMLRAAKFAYACSADILAAILHNVTSRVIGWREAIETPTRRVRLRRCGWWTTRMVPKKRWTRESGAGPHSPPKAGAIARTIGIVSALKRVKGPPRLHGCQPPRLHGCQPRERRDTERHTMQPG